MELGHGAVTSPDMTSPEVASPEVTGNDVAGSCITGNDFIGSDVTGSVREIMFAPFFSPDFCRVFSSETPRGLLGNFWEFPIGSSILPAEISTNEMP